MAIGLLGAALLAAAAGTEPAASRAEWMRGSVGLSVHWTASIPSADGRRTSFEEAVNAFDVTRFADKLKALGAQHLIFTTAHGEQMLPMPNAALDAIAPGRTTKRDLFGEILDACAARGIRVIAYYNHSCNGSNDTVRVWERQCAFPNGIAEGGSDETFARNISSIVGEMSRRYGSKISGWWFDSAYAIDSHGEHIGVFGEWLCVEKPGDWRGREVCFDWPRLLAAARSGNPDAAVAVNGGVGVNFQYEDDTDYYAGEAVSFYEPFHPQADGRRVETRWICADDINWTYDRTRGYSPLRRSVPELQAYVREHVRAGRMVTFNVLIDRTGRINPAADALKDVLNAAPSSPEELFANPPHEADVGVWWHWMGSAVTEEGIVKDLDYFKSVGIGYATVFAVSDTVMPWATPVGLGPFRKVVAFTPEWFRLLRFACAEGRKRGIEIGLHNSPGYTSTGGPWIPARLAMRELVFNVSATNPVPLRVKANFPRWVPERGTQDVPELAERRTDLVDIGTVGGVCVSHVPMGAFNQPAQPEATGLECDKLSAEAVTFHCDHVLGELKRHLGEEFGTGLTYLHLDSYEAGKATWTPRMREEFKARKGYDCLPLLPALGGFRTAFPDKEEQFRKDYDEVLKDLYRDNLFKIMGAKVRAAGLRFSCEPYSGPFRPEDGLPEIDAPMDEFWFELPAKWHPPVTWNRAKGPDGRRHNVIEAEAFTGQPQQTAWTETLAQIKAVGDIGLQRGLNRYFLHTCPLQPFADDVRPGMTMGRWGTHFGRTQTWARPAGAAWFAHQRRCQALLQWGEPGDAKLPLADPVRSTARTDGARTLHFVVNGGDRNAAFGLEGTWFDPVTGTVGAAPRQLAPRQRGFFEQVRTDRPAAFGPVTGEPVATLAGPWRLEFGGGGCLARTELFDWTKSKNRDVRYFSGTGVYRKTFDLAAAALAANRLDLGETLGHVSEVTLNGRDLGTVWTAPWSVAVPAGLLKEKGNVIEIRYTNVWANRLIGDERESDDCAWKSAGQYGGWYPVEWPAWSLRSIRERPARGRKAYCAWKHCTADAPLVPSGLLGPVAFYHEEPGCAAPDASQGDVPLWPEGRIPSVQTNQTVPFLRWFTPEKRTTDAILISVSGGGYNGCGVDGFEVAPIRDYFLKKGMTVVTMRYRAPRPQGLAKHVTAWQDAQRTVRLVRSEAAKRGLDPDNIGFTGCSAGGHLAMMVAVSSQTPAYSPVDEIDRLPCNVNWAIPVYPAYLVADGANQHNVKRGNDLSDALVPELAFDAATPPMCFFHGDVDGWSAMGSVRAYHKLRTMGVPAELHVMALENHCFQSNPRPGTSAASWKDRVWEWLVSMDIVTGHPQVWRKDWTAIFSAWGPKLEERADFVPGAWVLAGWGNVVLSAKQKGSSLWLKETFGDCEIDLEFRPEAASALLFRPAADESTAVRLDLRDVESVKGGWNRLTVRCANGVLEVMANGRRQTAVLVSVPSGRPIQIGFEGLGDSYRNVRIRRRQ